MVARRNRLPGSAPLPGPAGSSPAPRLDTLPNVARRLRRLAAGCGAEHFAMLLVADGEPRRFAPMIDSAYPGRDARMLEIAAALGERFLRLAAETTRPFWWSDDDRAPAALSLARCLWAENVPPPAPGTAMGTAMGTAVALPLLAERGETGLMVLADGRMAFTMASLAEIHAWCLSEFAFVAGLRPAAADAAPSMSRREVECLRLTAHGHTSEEIATRLGLSVHTTTQYIANSSQKLNAVNRVHAVAKAMRLGIID